MPRRKYTLTTTLSEAQFTASSGANVTSTTVSSGGLFTVSSGGNISDIAIYSGEKLATSSGVTISNAYIDTGELIAPSEFAFFNTSIVGQFTIPSNMNFIPTSVYTSAEIIVASGAIISNKNVGSLIVSAGRKKMVKSLFMEVMPQFIQM